MKLCWHDYETVEGDYKSRIKKYLTDYLKQEGFKEVEGKYFDRWEKRYKDSDVIIRILEHGFSDYQTVNDCIPYDPNIKVCLKCGKMKMNFDRDKSLKKLQGFIVDRTVQAEREYTAKNILKNKLTEK